MPKLLEVSYFVPLVILVAFGPYVTRRYGASGLSAMMLTVTLAVGLMLAILGGQHQRNLTLRSSLVGMVFAGFFFSVLVSVPAVSLVVLGRRGATIRRQRAIPLLVGIAIHIVAAVFYFLAVGCVLTGECL